MQPNSINEIANFFSSQSVALIGASPKDNRIYPNLIRFFKGKIFPVNPKYSEVYGLRCFSSLNEIPEKVDSAAIMVPRDGTTKILRDCGEHGIKYAIVFAAGFAEVDEKGKEMDIEIRNIAHEYGMTVIGPNSGGFINSAGLSLFWAPNAPVPPSTSGIGMVSQSGGIMTYVYRLGVVRRMGFSYLISSGNETVTKLTDYFRFLIADDRTKVIVLSIEGIEDGVELRKLFEEALRIRKPVIMLKLGLSEKGVKTVSLHSGRMATSGRILKALCQQFGVIWVERVDQILDVLEILLKSRQTKGNRIGVAMFSGGMGVFLSDNAANLGLDLAEPTMSTREKFTSLLSVPKSGIENPFDLSPLLIATKPSTLIRILAEDGNYDWLMIRCPLLQEQMPEFLRQVKEASNETSFPVVCFAPITEEKNTNDEDVPVIGGLENALASISRVSTYFATRARPIAPEPSSLGRSVSDIVSSAEASPLRYEEATKLLNLYGISSVETRAVRNPDEALSAARAISYPIVLKRDGYFHRTEINAVKTDIRNDEELIRAFQDLASIEPDPERFPFLVQKYTHGVEVIIGLKKDPQMGQCIIFGIGGIFAEALDDLSIRLPPLNIDDARDMIQEVKGSRLLFGYRGEQKRDVDALAQSIVNLSRIAVDLKNQLTEMDINPLFVLDQGKGVKAADVKIVLDEKSIKQV